MLRAKTHHKIFIPFLLVLFLCSCKEPVLSHDFYSFKRNWAEDSSIVFSIDIQDRSGALYLCAQIMESPFDSEEESLPIMVLFYAPDGSRYYDTVSLPIRHKKGEYVRNGIVSEREWKYLKVPEPKISGAWKIELRHFGEHDLYRNVTGLGISFRYD